MSGRPPLNALFVNPGWYRNTEKGKRGFEDDLMSNFAGIAESYGIALDDDAFAA